MITMGIGLVAGVFYWLASYKLAFWILIYAIIYGGLGILRGDNHARPIYRGDSEVTVAVLLISLARGYQAKIFGTTSEAGDWLASQVRECRRGATAAELRRVAKELVAEG